MLTRAAALAAAAHYMDRTCIRVNLFTKAKNMLKKSYITTALMPAARLGRPVTTTWDYDNAIKHGYNRSATVYSCINLIAKSAASVQWKTYKRTRGGVWEEIVDHP